MFSVSDVPCPVTEPVTSTEIVCKTPAQVAKSSNFAGNLFEYLYNEYYHLLKLTNESILKITAR